MSCLGGISGRHIISFSATTDEYYYDSLDCSQSSRFGHMIDQIQDREIEDNDKIQNIWHHRDINYYGRKYIPGWRIRGLNRLDITFNKFRSFLYLIQMSGTCNFAKRNEIYTNLTLLHPESTRTNLMSRKRFNLIVIAWHYVNQAYFRRKQQLAYQQLSPFYQVEDKVIRRFECYYQLRQKTNKVVL
jgi:hypothetical protein